MFPPLNWPIRPVSYWLMLNFEDSRVQRRYGAHPTYKMTKIDAHVIKNESVTIQLVMLRISIPNWIVYVKVNVKVNVLVLRWIRRYQWSKWIKYNSNQYFRIWTWIVIKNGKTWLSWLIQPKWIAHNAIEFYRRMILTCTVNPAPFLWTNTTEWLVPIFIGFLKNKFSSKVMVFLILQCEQYWTILN